MEQFLDDIREILGQRLTYFRTGVFRGDIAAHTHQLMDGDAVPVVEISLLSLDQFEFLFRIIDQRAKLFLFRLTDGVAKELVYFSLDVTRGIL